MTYGQGGSGPHKSEVWASWAQVVGTVISAAAVVIALLVAVQGQKTVDNNSRTTLRQSEDSQLSTAIDALGSSVTAERVAGLLLLTRNTSGRFALFTQTGEPRTEVYDDYTTALQILSGFLASRGEAFISKVSNGKNNSEFGHGYGVPPKPGMPRDVIYAANQVHFLLSRTMLKKVRALHAGQPAIDLANDELYGQPWDDGNFGGIPVFMTGVDLRGADLAESRWSGLSTLLGSYLQCANLQGAVFGRANLRDAHLNGAYVEGADFTKAKLQGVTATVVYGRAKWPWRLKGMTVLPAKKWSPHTQSVCLQNHKFWEDQPNSSPIQASAPSPKPTSTPTPKPSASKNK